jgi:hypothetical protein
VNFDPGNRIYDGLNGARRDHSTITFDSFQNFTIIENSTFITNDMLHIDA